VTKDEAQRRADQIRAFQAEVAALSREGVRALPAEQAALVAAHHDALLASLAAEFDVDRTDASRRMSLGMRFASAFGAAALTAAIVSFCYRIWGSLSTPAQVALLTAAPLVSLGAMVIAARRERTLYIASLCAIAAYGAFVLQTVALGDLFNMQPSHRVLAVWAVFGFAVAWPFRLGVPFAAAVIFGICYAAALGFSLLGGKWDDFFDWPETQLLPAAFAYVAVQRTPPELHKWGRGAALSVGLLGLLFVAHGRPDTLLPWGSRFAGVFYQVVAVGVAAGVIALGVRKARGETLVIGAAFAGCFLIGRFVDWWWAWMPKYLFFLIIAATCIAWLWLLGRLRRRVAGAPAR
jgi:hypothetical protein